MPHVRLSVRGSKTMCFDCFYLIDIAKALVGFALLFGPRTLRRTWGPVQFLLVSVRAQTLPVINFGPKVLTQTLKMEQSQLRVDSQTLWYVLWSTMCLTSVGDALAPYPIFSGKMGMSFNLLVAAIAGIQMLVRGTFLRHKEAGLATVLLMVFITAQLSQWARTMGPPPQNSGVDFSAYYLAARVLSDGSGQSLYQLPLYPDGRMDLNAQAPLSSSWHTAALRYNVPFSAPYIYPPFFAILMKPFARLSFSSALTAWKLSTVLLLAGAVLLSLSIGGVRIDWRLALILSTGLFSYYPFLDNLFWGQVGGLILFLLTAGVWLQARNRTSLSALCFAAATLIKLTPALALPVLIFHRRWKWLAAYGVWIIVILVFSVWQAGWAMHQQFWHDVLPKISCGVPVSENSSVVAYVQDLFLGQVHSAQSPPLTIPPYACTFSRF